MSIPTIIKYRLSQRNKPILIHNQKEYLSSHKTALATYFTCIKRPCPGRAIIKKGCIKISKEHTCICEPSAWVPVCTLASNNVVSLPRVSSHMSSNNLLQDRINPCATSLPKTASEEHNTPTNILQTHKIIPCASLSKTASTNLQYSTKSRMIFLPTGLLTSNNNLQASTTIPSVNYLPAGPVISTSILPTSLINPRLVGAGPPTSSNILQTSTTIPHKIYFVRAGPAAATNLQPSTINSQVISLPTGPVPSTNLLPPSKINHGLISLPKEGPGISTNSLQSNAIDSPTISLPKAPNYELMKSCRGKYLLFSDGFSYDENQVHKTTKYYRCRQSTCLARGKLKNGTFSITKQHTHDPDESAYFVYRTRNLLKEEMLKNPSSKKSQVYDRVMRQVVSDVRTHDIPGAMPMYENVRVMLRRCTRVSGTAGSL